MGGDAGNPRGRPPQVSTDLPRLLTGGWLLVYNLDP